MMCGSTHLCTSSMCGSTHLWWTTTGVDPVVVVLPLQLYRYSWSGSWCYTYIRGADVGIAPPCMGGIHGGAIGWSLPLCWLDSWIQIKKKKNNFVRSKIEYSIFHSFCAERLNNKFFLRRKLEFLFKCVV